MRSSEKIANLTFSAYGRTSCGGPASIAGPLADDVSSVALYEIGHQQALPITNNSFFVELNKDSHSTHSPFAPIRL